MRLIEDREGNIWLGTTTGLLRLEPRRLRVFSCREGLRNDEIQAVVKGVDGTIWLGTAHGVSGIREGKVFNLAAPLWATEWNHQWSRVPCLLADSQNQLWICPYQHLTVYTNGQGGRILPPIELQRLTVQFLYEDRQKCIWLGTDHGAFCLNDGRWTAFTSTNDLGSADIRVIYQDRRDDMWFGTFGGGLIRMHDKQFTSYKTPRGPHNNRAWWIYEDTDGLFWVGSEDGLNRFVPEGVGRPQSSPRQHKRVTDTGEKDPFFTFTTKHGLGENVVNNIQEDEFGYLWLSGLKGIYRISRHELNDIAGGERSGADCAAYGESDGMLNSECNGGDNQPAGCKDELGRIWFPTARGVVVIEPAQVQPKEVPPLVVVEQVRANEEVIFGDGIGDGAKMTHGAGFGAATRISPGGARALEIHYTANSLVAPEKLQFKYRLVGYNNDWTDARERRVASYTNLRPGDYRFELKARNHHGLWCECPAQFAFTLAPHFYETWTFYGLCGLGLVGLAGGMQTYRLGVQRRILRLDAERHLERERTRIARDLHDDLGASLTGVALQLEAAQRMGGAKGGQLAALATETRSLAHELRELAWTTNPRCDNAGSLVAFIGEYTERFCQSARLACSLDLPATIDQVVPARVRHELLMVLKEGLTNIAKHARAHSVKVELLTTDSDVALRITDDGCGFDPGKKRAGTGLANLRERVQQARGRLTVESRAGPGTTLAATLPLCPTRT